MNNAIKEVYIIKASKKEQETKKQRIKENRSSEKKVRG